MNKFIAIALFFLAASGSFAETIVFLDKKTVKGEILDYRKDTVSLLDEEQGKIISYQKKQILYISFDSENEALQKKIEEQIVNQLDSFKPGSDILIDSDGIIRKGRISQWLKKNILLDTGENIEEIGISDAFGIYFVQDKSYYSDKKKEEASFTFIKKEKTRYKGKLLEIKNNSVVLSENNTEIEIVKKELSWIYFAEENAGLRKKAESDYLNAYQYLPGNDLLVFQNGLIEKVTVIRKNGFILEYENEGRIESADIGKLYGIYYGPVSQGALSKENEKTPAKEQVRTEDSRLSSDKKTGSEYDKLESFYFNLNLGVALTSSYSDSSNKSYNKSAIGFFDFGIFFTFSENVSAGLNYTGFSLSSYSSTYVDLSAKYFFDRVNTGLFINGSLGLQVGNSSNTGYSSSYSSDSGVIFKAGLGYAIERSKYESSYLIGMSFFYIYESGKANESVYQGAPYYNYIYVSSTSNRTSSSLMFYAGVFW